ncbi:hypothetical protein ACHQM5_001783 [Ranunculus cassubicifolius]
MKLFRALLHETIESVNGSSTISNVFVRNGGGPISFSPSTGCGYIGSDEEPPPPPMISMKSSSLTISFSMILWRAINTNDVDSFE